jgi:hypothetical protein
MIAEKTLTVRRPPSPVRCSACRLPAPIEELAANAGLCGRCYGLLLDPTAVRELPRPAVDLAQ